MEVFFIVICALLLDGYLGEPRRAHPLIGFGKVAQWIENRYYGSPEDPVYLRRLRGILAVSLAVLPIAVISAYLAKISYLGMGIEILLLYLAVGGQSLTEHALRVKSALEGNSLENARREVGYMVSRETQNMQPRDVARAAVESILENGNDAIFGALFWYVIAGVPGIVIYRLTNTLDAMWGYRNDRYFYFGWAAARLDDVLNFIPARLTALSYAIVGKFRLAIQCWYIQAKHWESPNAGPVMAAGAGALGLQLGGAAFYHGEMKDRPNLGAGSAPEIDDIKRAIALVQRSTILWVCMIAVGGWWIA